MYETEDPEVFAKLYKEKLLEQFGDIPEVHIVVEVERARRAKEPMAMTALKAASVLL